VNYGFTAGTTTISYVTLHFGLGISNQWLIPGLLVFCTLFPVVFFSFARSLWLNLDCFVDPEGAMEGMNRASRAFENENEKKH
jgi:hypothetical protein